MAVLLTPRPPPTACIFRLICRIVSHASLAGIDATHGNSIQTETGRRFWNLENECGRFHVRGRRSNQELDWIATRKAKCTGGGNHDMTSRGLYPGGGKFHVRCEGDGCFDLYGWQSRPCRIATDSSRAQAEINEWREINGIGTLFLWAAANRATLRSSEDWTGQIDGCRVSGEHPGCLFCRDVANLYDTSGTRQRSGTGREPNSRGPATAAGGSIRRSGSHTHSGSSGC